MISSKSNGTSNSTITSGSRSKISSGSSGIECSNINNITDSSYYSITIIKTLIKYHYLN